MNGFVASAPHPAPPRPAALRPRVYTPHIMAAYNTRYGVSFPADFPAVRRGATVYQHTVCLCAMRMRIRVQLTVHCMAPRSAAYSAHSFLDSVFFILHRRDRSRCCVSTYVAFVGRSQGDVHRFQRYISRRRPDLCFLSALMFRLLIALSSTEHLARIFTHTWRSALD